MKETYDVIVVGMGPGAIFFAYEMIKLNKNKLHYDLYIVVRENGRSTIPIVDL